MSRMTKQQLVDENTALRIELDRLRSEVAAFRTAAAQQTSTKYPLTDRLGRHYRLEGNIKCYPAKH